jgi:mRNA interferase MazF
MGAKPGEVWLTDLGLAAKTRPVVILSRDDPDAPRALVTYVPLTTQNRGSRYEIEIGKLRFLREASVANVQGIGQSPQCVFNGNSAFSRSMSWRKSKTLCDLL